MEVSAASMIKRFREGKPTSRAERMSSLNDGKVSEMWYLQDKNSSSASKNNTNPGANSKSSSSSTSSSTYYSKMVDNGIDHEPRRSIPIPDRQTTDSATMKRTMTFKDTIDPYDSIELYSNSKNNNETNRKNNQQDDPMLYSFDDDAFLAKALGRKIPIKATDPRDVIHNNSGSNQLPTYRFRDSLKLSSDGNFINSLNNKDANARMVSPFNSVDTLGSTGFKALLMADYRLDYNSKSNKDTTIQDITTTPANKNPYEYDFVSAANDGANAKLITANMEDLLKTLHADNANLLQEQYQHSSYTGKSIKEIGNNLHSEMNGFKAIFDEKYHQIDSEEMQQKKRDEAMKEAGRLEERSLLTMLDDISSRSPFDLLINPAMHGPKAQVVKNNIGVATTNGNNSSGSGSGSSYNNRSDNSRLIHNSNSAVGIVQAALDIEYAAAMNSMNKIQAIRSGLVNKMKDINYMNSNNNNNSGSNNCNSYATKPSSVDGNANSVGYIGENKSVEKRQLTIMHDEVHHIHDAVSKTTKGICATLDEAIHTLKHNIEHAPVATAIPSIHPMVTHLSTVPTTPARVVGTSSTPASVAKTIAAGTTSATAPLSIRTNTPRDNHAPNPTTTTTTAATATISSMNSKVIPASSAPNSASNSLTAIPEFDLDHEVKLKEIEARSMRIPHQSLSNSNIASKHTYIVDDASSYAAGSIALPWEKQRDLIVTQHQQSSIPTAPAASASTTANKLGEQRAQPSVPTSTGHEELSIYDRELHLQRIRKDRLSMARYISSVM